MQHDNDDIIVYRSLQQLRESFEEESEVVNKLSKEINDKLKNYGKETGYPIIFDNGDRDDLINKYQIFNAMGADEKKLINIVISQLTGGMDFDGTFRYLKSYYNKRDEIGKIPEKILDISKEEVLEESFKYQTTLLVNSVLYKMTKRFADKMEGNIVLSSEEFKIFIDDVNKNFNGYIYILGFSGGDSLLRKGIRKFTKMKYFHSSVSFDEKLNTMVSFSAEGLTREHPLMGYESDIDTTITRIKVSDSQKNKILDFIENISTKGSQYNIIGLIKNYILKLKNNFDYGEDKMMLVCSQFVHLALREAGLIWWDSSKIDYTNDYEYVRPGDFFINNNKRKMSVVYDGNLFKRYLDTNNNEITVSPVENKIPGIFRYKVVVKGSRIFLEPTKV